MAEIALGFEFECLVFEELKKLVGDNYVVRREKEVKDNYGKGISAIDIQVFNVVKPKNAGKEVAKHVFIQLKWRDARDNIKSINHFIHCCNEIRKQEKVDSDHDVLHIYGTKLPVGGVGHSELMKLNIHDNCDNLHDENMAVCVGMIINKVKKFYNIKQRKEKKLDASEKEVENTILPSLAAPNYSIPIRQNAIALAPVVPSQSAQKWLTLEYNEPTKRNNDENKSKLLKHDSELFKFITNLKYMLNTQGFEHKDRMDLHTEVLNNRSESHEIFLSRVAQLEGRKIDVYDMQNYQVIDNRIIIRLGSLEGYLQPARITLAYFTDKNPADAINIIFNYIKMLASNMEKVEKQPTPPAASILQATAPTFAPALYRNTVPDFEEISAYLLENPTKIWYCKL